MLFFYDDYRRLDAVDYARRWAFDRNPAYYDFSAIGGDCTNFASQCLYAGCGVMNDTPEFGWYYFSVDDRAPAWTGVEFFSRFLLRSERSRGPVARLCPPWELEAGDMVQLSFDDRRFSHTLVVMSVGAGEILVSAHSDDALDRPLDSYPYRLLRCLHITGYWE